jgi:phosphatidylglycerol:prolipoprotein diacylglycerol transferase
MYVLGFVGGWMLALRRSQQKWSVIRPEQVDDLIFYCMLGVILGGRIGYCIFYGWEYWLQDPLYVFKITQGGMSFHGGLLGVMFAMWLYGRLALGKGMLQVTDFAAPLAPIGLGTGRIGNFINGELWGKPTDLPWAFNIDGVGVVFSARERPHMAVSGLFLVCYGVMRFCIEFVRVPDADLGYLALGWVTMGQVLTTPMILLGVILLFLAYRNNHPQEAMA